MTRRHQPVAEIVVDVLATYRLARLVSADTFPPVRHARERILGRYPTSGTPIDLDYWTPTGDGEEYRAPDGRTIDTRKVPALAGTEVVAVMPEPHPLGELVTCPWCCSMWIGLGVIAARRLAPRAWDPLARALVGSAAAGLLAGWSHS